MTKKINKPERAILNDVFVTVTSQICKCGSDPSNFKNLRPFSNLSYISKVIESAVADQIQLHLAKNNL